MGEDQKDVVLKWELEHEAQMQWVWGSGRQTPSMIKTVRN